jgi:hypothetical protein
MGMMEWQPISTAPKDRQILISNKDGIGVGKWKEEPYTSYFMGGAFQGIICGWEAWCGGSEYDVVIDNPSHWMNLPEPPKQD